MRFYTGLHRYYCGIDLHARSMYLCVLDHETGKVLLHRNVPCEPAVRGPPPGQPEGALGRRMDFTLLASNTDDHLRNDAFLRDGPGWVLSPAYDINPTSGEIKPRVLATALGEDYNGTSASLETALSVAPYFDIEEADAWRIVRALAGG